MSPSSNDIGRFVLKFLEADSELNEISEEKWSAKGDRNALLKSFESFLPVH